MANDALKYLINNSLSIKYYSNTSNPKIYPNPVKEILFVDNSVSKSSKIEIYSIIGTLVYKRNTSSENLIEKLDISKLSNGIYFLKMNSNSIKFIKN